MTLNGVALAAGAALLGAAAAGPLAATNLRAEYLLNPPLIDTPTPRFSWEVGHTERGQAQSAYRLVVSNLATGALAYDSGKVASAATAQVLGGTYDADARYTWTVSWWDAAGNAAPWAAANGTFGTGSFGDAAWDAAGAQWIGCADQGTNTTNGGSQLRAEFTLPPPKTPGAAVTQARLYVAGLGWHVAYFNGMRLGEAILEPVFTGLRQRVPYTAHDVTRGISATGPNVFAVLLGHGWPEIIVPWAESGSGDPAWNGSAASASSTAVAPSGATAEVMRALRERDYEVLARLTEEDLAPLRSGHTGYQRRLRAMLSIKYADGSSATVVTSAAGMGAAEPAAAKRVASAAAPQFMCGAGALLHDNIYDGTTYDATQETVGWLQPGYAYNTPSATAWSAAVRIAEPGGRMVGSAMPGVEIMDTFTPISMWESTPGSYVFDLGQNAAGAVLIKVPAGVPAGTQLTVRHSESRLHPPYGNFNGSLYYGNLRSAKATDVYTTAGKPAEAALMPQLWWDGIATDGGNTEAFFPLFTWHGFRYVEISGLPFAPTLDGVVLGIHFRSALPTTGSIAFPASADVMNQLQHAIQWGQASNLMGNPSDCPQRDERLGWTGDSALTAEEATYNFDTAAFYLNWANSLQEAMTNSIDPTWPGSASQIPAVVPDVTGGYGQDLSWESVYPSVVHAIFSATGDTAAVAQHWPFLLAYANNSYVRVITGNKPGNWGDWCPPPAVQGTGQGPKPPVDLTAAATFLADMSLLVEMGAALGDAANTTKLISMRDDLIANFRARYWNASGSFFGPSPVDGLQTAQSAALGTGVATDDEVPAVAAVLVNDIVNAKGGHSVVGIIGQKFITRALTATGFSAVAVNMTLQTEYPSFGYAFNHPIEPATTLWELPDGPSEGPAMNSRNHIMQGAIGAWLYSDVLGIAQQPGTQGYASLLVWPRTTDHPSLPQASGSYASIKGVVSVSWVNATNGTGVGGPGSFTLSVQVPVGATAEVRLPYNIGVTAGALVAAEGGKTFFTGNAFVPGAVAGVTGAMLWQPTAGLPALRVFCGSGTYAFTLSW